MKGRVDCAGFDSGYGRIDVSVQCHDVQLDARMRAIEVLDQKSGCNPPTEDVDPERPPARTHGCVGPLCDPQEFTGMRQESLAVDGELGAGSTRQSLGADLA